MLKKLWSVKKEDVEKQSVFWNMMSSGLNSVVSMLLLWVVTRVNGVYDAGIFSLGFSTSQMMLTIGNYGMRNYQATDIEDKYSMKTYLASRIVTNIFMLMIVAGFVKTEGYFLEKAAITVLLCVLKATDAFDDVYGGHYQRKGRLDISGKIMTLRIFAYIAAFCVCLVTTHSLISSSVAAIVVSTGILVMLVVSTREVLTLEKPAFEWNAIKNLLTECFPLCISAFLLIYLGNAPKYAIDAYMSPDAQAYYTYLFMPCFVTNLFVGFALQPLLVRLSKSWLHKEYSKFLRLCACIFAGAISISAVIIAAGGFLGCQVLSLVFGVQLSAYREVLVVLLIGGAFFAFAVIAQIILTVMRKQFCLLIGFALASFAAFLTADPLVERWGLEGAGYSYTISAGVLFLALAVMIAFFFPARKKDAGEVH